MSQNCGHISNYQTTDSDSYCWVIYFSICSHCVVYPKHAFADTLSEESKRIYHPNKVLFCDRCLEPRYIRQANVAIDNYNIKIIKSQ